MSRTTALAPSSTSAQAPALAASTPASPDASCRSLNARKHGLTARNFVFSAEEAVAYAAHVAGLLEHYQPAGPIEEALVRQIADGIWRLDRASAIEHGIFAATLESVPADAPEIDRLLAPARTWLAEGKNLALLSLYVKRIENKLAVNKTELTLLQNARKVTAPAKAEFQAEPKTHIDTSAAAAAPSSQPIVAVDRPFNPFSPSPLIQPPSRPNEFVFSARLFSTESNRRAIVEAAYDVRKQAA